MSDGSTRKLNGAARPIKTRRDYKGAETVVRKISDQADRESAAEKRLQSLIKEMDKFDAVEDEDPDLSSDGGYSGPRRRWSDESTDPE
ncbi:MAG TPA: hypothetical protein VF460_06660 [Burkholderiales bacterium]